jgi:hypothetical protein
LIVSKQPSPYLKERLFGEIQIFSSSIIFPFQLEKRDMILFDGKFEITELAEIVSPFIKFIKDAK